MNPEHPRPPRLTGTRLLGAAPAHDPIHVALVASVMIGVDLLCGGDAAGQMEADTSGSNQEATGTPGCAHHSLKPGAWPAAS